MCEKKLLHEELNEGFFVQELEKNISELEGDVDTKLVNQMVDQGNYRRHKILLVNIPCWYPRIDFNKLHLISRFIEMLINRQ